MALPIFLTSQVTEYKSGRGDPPYYHCRLESCQDEQGNAEAMKNHLFTLRHKQVNFLLSKKNFLILIFLSFILGPGLVTGEDRGISRAPERYQPENC